MSTGTLFSKIISRKIPADIIYEDELVTAFKDVCPKAPIHILIVTNEIIRTVNDVKTEHEKMLGRLFIAASKIASKENIDKDGYRLIVNCNTYGNQDIYHLHMHLLGGKPLGPILADQ